MAQRGRTGVEVPWGLSNIFYGRVGASSTQVIAEVRTRNVRIDGLSLFVDGCWGGTSFTCGIEVLLPPELLPGELSGSCNKT